MPHFAFTELQLKSKKQRVAPGLIDSNYQASLQCVSITQELCATHYPKLLEILEVLFTVDFYPFLLSAAFALKNRSVA